MTERPELPTFFAHRLSVYDVLPDSKPMTWSVWDAEGWLGDIARGGGANGEWSSVDGRGRTTGPHGDWQAAVAGLIDDL